MLSRWYRTGVIYSLDIGLFQDANGDGIGDVQGLNSRLEDYRLVFNSARNRAARPGGERVGGLDLAVHRGSSKGY